MKLDFDLEKVKVTEFGVGLDSEGAHSFRLVAVDSSVQEALREIVFATRDAMQELTAKPLRYEPSEKHGSTEYLYLPLKDGLATSMKRLHEAANLPFGSDIMAHPDSMFCYFARLTDKTGRRLTALRRATQFKGILKSRLLRFTTDALKLIEDHVFKLDRDFDLLIDSKNVHVLRPSGFEFAGQIQDAVLKAVPKNIAALQKDLAFVDFDAVQAFACTHPRAARYLASVCAQEGNGDIDKTALKRLCKDTGVEVAETNGKLVVDDENAMGFLEVLDRRRYGIELVTGAPERFRAASRSRLDK